MQEFVVFALVQAVVIANGQGNGNGQISILQNS